MALGSYDESRWNERDELRALLLDNEVEEGTTVVPDAIVSDTVYDKLFASKGFQTGAVQIATMYANWADAQVKRYANTQAGTAAEFYERGKGYRQTAEDLRTGKIVIGTTARPGGIMLGHMQAGLAQSEHFDRTGVFAFPDKEDV